MWTSNQSQSSVGWGVLRPEALPPGLEGGVLSSQNGSPPMGHPGSILHDNHSPPWTFRNQTLLSISSLSRYSSFAFMPP